MRLPPVVIKSMEQVLPEVFRFDGAVDHLLSRYFRLNPKLGMRDRQAIAQGIYGLLRNKAVYSNFAESGSGSVWRRLALLSLGDEFGIESLGGLSEEEIAWLTKLLKIDRSVLPLAVRCNMPEWLFARLITQTGEDSAVAFAQACMTSAPLDVRINSLKTTRDEILTLLKAQTIAAEPTPFSPLGVRIAGKPMLQKLNLFEQGLIEVQDEGSQLLAQIVGAKRGEMVIDFCAGAGGKTLALGAAMRNTGRLYALDISEKRLNNLKPRLARSGLSNIHPVWIAHENDLKVKRMMKKADRVLVDAPCTGLGMLRRNPEIKWRHTERALDTITEKQQAILSSAARLVKPGGRLVYATCSVLQQENEEIVAGFLSAHPQFLQVPMKDILAEQKIPLEMGDYLKLFPHQHHTDGFFAGVFSCQS